MTIEKQLNKDLIPAMKSIDPFAKTVIRFIKGEFNRLGKDLDDELKQINYEGTAVIAAHQYLVAKGEEGYLIDGIAKIDEKEFFIELGEAVIAKFKSPL